MALKEFMRDPSIHVVETSHVEQFGRDRVKELKFDHHRQRPRATDQAPMGPEA
jgi:hypothetical protein